ncbi:MAG: RecQ family ATP-dependent DNA helicase [Cyclobacteriaceae bacterium]|nr:RecQ family ATP-dependent DNA helicase [Cyclobacteriaceae bacterium]
MTENQPIDILKKYWGYPAFRPMQEDIIHSVMEGKDTLALLPTGGGKSICFQVPGMLLDGVCLVVSPLIALMRDQVQQLNQRGIRAMALYSGMSAREMDIALDNVVYAGYKFLYVSPERLKTPLMLARADKLNISLLAIDEAHCISQWGYDFRPPYLEIADFREEFEIPRIMALTATATRDVKEDILSRLRMKTPVTFQQSFARKNLSYSVFETEKKLEKLESILQHVNGSGLVYVRSRKRTREVAQWLAARGISADFYHAGLLPQDRAACQQKWISGRTRIVVATNAFGMGIDKPDVRTVVHLDLPETLEAYYQEAGRAGRDGHRAYAVLLYHRHDQEELLHRLGLSDVTTDLMKRVYQALANHYKLAVGSGEDQVFDFDYKTFVASFNLPVNQTYFALKKMMDEGLIDLNESFFHASRFNFIITHEELYKFQVAHAILDPIIKALLRLYGGELYQDFVEIKELALAEFLKVQKDQVVKWLELLHQYNVAEYHRATTQPQLTFLTPRMDAASLPLEKDRYEKRRKIVEEKAAAVTAYAGESRRCRTRMLQAYFDELTDQDCGACDYCLREKKNQRAIPDENVWEAIPEAGISMEELMRTVPGTAEAVMKTVRRMLDDGKVEIENEQWIKRRKV